LVEKSLYKPDVTNIDFYYKCIRKVHIFDNQYTFVTIWLKWLNHFPEEAKAIFDYIDSVRDDSKVHRKLEEFLRKNVPLYEERKKEIKEERKEERKPQDPLLLQ
jgi:hypothetical protein